MYLLKVRKVSETIASFIEDENEALRRMRAWRHHPEFVYAEVRKLETVAVPYSVVVAAQGGTHEVR